MSLVLDVPPELKSELAAEAAQLGLLLFRIRPGAFWTGAVPSARPRARAPNYSPIDKARASSVRGPKPRTLRHAPGRCGNKPSGDRGPGRWTSLRPTC
jgi:hypothetical protein